MRQTAVGFTSKKLTLEGVLTIPDRVPGPHPAIVVCHPHPALNGNMENTVVTAICRAADQQGLATLRFNFRGVGGSQGTFSNGQEENHDLKAALNLLKNWSGINQKRIAMVGYSFGASVILRDLRNFKLAHSIVLIAPPISTVQNSSILNDTRPSLFLVGTLDRIARATDLQRFMGKVPPSVTFSEIIDADHNLRQHEDTVATRAVTFLISAFAESA